MEILIKNTSLLTYEEIYFAFSMLRKFGGMPNPTVNNGNNVKNKKRNFKSPKLKQINEKYPDLYNLQCPKWKNCTDDRFLCYKIIMEKIIVND